MSTEIRSKSLEFINYLRSTDEYKAVLEKFKEYLKTTNADRNHKIVFNFDYMQYDYGEWLDIQERDSNLISLTFGSFWNGNLDISEIHYG